ncbi:hypothetical protein P7C70_g6150, partial [Phenoliferia sp. Uapishka_3]
MPAPTLSTSEDSHSLRRFSTEAKGKQREYSPRLSLLPPAPSWNSMDDSPSHISHTPSAHTTSTGIARRLGKLGIPVPSDDGINSDSESLEANPPGTPATPHILGHEASPELSTEYRKARSEPLEVVPVDRETQMRSDSSRDGAAWSEHGFRDIVDDLTLQNQQLKSRLRRYEAAKIPNDLRRDRLFEVRFFEGLPKFVLERRQEIESFLTSYVQDIAPNPESLAHPYIHPHPHSQPYLNTLHLPVEPHSSAGGGTATTSSIGVTLRSLRTSERDKLYYENGGPGPTEYNEGESGSGSGSGGVGGSGRRGERQRSSRESTGGQYNVVRSVSGSGSARKFRSTRRKEQLDGTISPPSPAPLAPPHTATSTLRNNLSYSTHPPPLLRRLPPPFQVERDILASASYSGLEPMSRTGTGSGMRISNPSTKKRRRTDGEPAAPTPIRPPLLRRRSSDKERSSGSEEVLPRETLGRLVVEMVERIFEESLPLISPEGLPPPRVPSPPNPLNSEPSPLPTHSFSNTHYLRELLTGTEESGHWIYLNLLLTFAGVHRLNVSIGFVRHALRTQSSLIEVSEEGNKVRWKGPATRVLKPDRRAVGEVEEDVKTSGREHEDALIEDASVHEVRRASAEEAQESTPSSFKLSSATGQTKDSTAATSLSLGPGGSKNPSTMSLVSGGLSGGPLTSSGNTSSGASGRSTRDKIPEYDVVGDDPVGISHGVNKSPPLATYVPLFGKRITSSNSSVASEEEVEQGDDEASPEEDDGGRATKRRKGGVGGGVIFFNSDQFCSDLAGDSNVRERLRRLAEIGTASMANKSVRTQSASLASWSNSSGVISRELSPLSKSWDDAGSEADDEVQATHLKVYPCHLLTDAAMSELGKLPLAPLALSGMSSAVPNDHFTIICHTIHRLLTTARSLEQQDRLIMEKFSLPSPSSLSTSTRHCPSSLSSLLETRTITHPPAVKVRFPRVHLLRSDESSDGENNEMARNQPVEPLPDYMLSLALPLNRWARESARLEEEEGSEDEEMIDV